MANKTGIFSWTKGSGKTTTCAYLAAALATMHRRVVCVDLNGDLQKYLQLQGEAVEVAGLRWKYRKWSGEEDKLEDDADYILVDIPGEFSPAQQAVLRELDSVLIPVEAEHYGLEGLPETLQKIAEQEHLLIGGIVLTKADRHSYVPETIEAELKEYFSPFVMNTKISRNYYLARPSFSLTDLGEKGWHSGFIDYLKLANELLEHEY
ncbi:MAG: ParA family protein [Leadbetterella sp.]|nr:ParA family protein [Leadbetterella sp.]